ncbi:MAG: methyltransferase domain-containing protein [Ilumatobacteraceae bacterium]
MIMTNDTEAGQRGVDWTVVDRGWGHAVVDFATLSEPANVREYVSMHEHLRIGPGDRILDIACGSGLAVELAHLRGAVCAGIDASERLIAVARDRNPDADLRVGDMHALPWGDENFDIVTSFRGIWGTTPDALAEAFRVLKPGGHVGVTVWGHIKASPGAWALAPFRLAAAPKVENQAAMVALGRPGAGEAMLARYGFDAVTRVTVPFVWEFTDPQLYARALASTGPAFEAIEHIGEGEFHRIAMAAAREHLRHGLPLRAEIDVVGYLARKPSQPLITPHFLREAPVTPESESLCSEDVKDLGFVMNVTRLWSWQPTTVQEFFDLMSRATKDRLSFRERGLIVLATASSIDDSYCSMAWAHKLTPTVGADVAAAVLHGDDSALTPTEQAITSWIRRVLRNATTTTTEDIDELRHAGVDDDKIFALTFYAAMRMAFSTINNALGAHPDSQFRANAAPQVLAAIDYGRPTAAQPIE